MDITRAFPSTKEDQTLARLIQHMKVVREFWPSIVWMKQALEQDDKFMFLEEWEAMSRDAQSALWVAPTYGGIFTTEQRKTIRQWVEGQS